MEVLDVGNLRVFLLLLLLLLPLKVLTIFSRSESDVDGPPLDNVKVDSVSGIRDHSRGQSSHPVLMYYCK